MVGDILQPTHLLFVLVVALIVLGPKRLPEVGRSLGRGLRDFRNALSGEDSHEPMIPPASSQTPVQPAEPAEPTRAPAESPAAAPVAGASDPDPQPVSSAGSQRPAS